MDKPNKAPKVIDNPEYIFVDKYETLELDLKEVFNDAENDRLFYKVNDGYVVNDKYYLESSNAGINDIQITACDMKGGEATIDFTVIADIETLVMTPSLAIDFIPDFTGASTWAVLDMLEAVRNGIVTENIMGSYQKPITREEFCVYMMNFYNTVNKKEQKIKIKDPFTDTNNPDILKAYCLGIIDGISADKFAPNGYVTKELMCTTIMKTLLLLNPGMYPDNIEEFKLSDADQISPSARSSINFCISNGIITIDGNNKINPKDNLSREQVIVIANRAHGLFVDDVSK